MSVRRATALMVWAGRRVARPVVVLAGLWAAVAVVGEWVTAAGLAAVILVRGVAAWVVLEQRLDCGRPTDTAGLASARRGAGVVGHVAFARALVAVSERYLELCEDQADGPGRASGERWR
jgi:hypothetical protein